VLLPPLAAPTDAEAISMPSGTLSYRELRDAAAAVAAQLPAGERVAVWAVPELATVVGVVGALAAGSPIVPLNPKSGTGELEHELGDAQPAAVLASAGAGLPEPLAPLRRIATGPATRARAPWPHQPHHPPPAGGM
jgi:malonyl-CoA/methylmalonyl-CoA synthetase